MAACSAVWKLYTGLVSIRGKEAGWRAEEGVLLLSGLQAACKDDMWYHKADRSLT